MSGKFSPDEIEKVADQLDAAAWMVDETGMPLPLCISTSIFSQPAANLMTLLGARGAELALRSNTAAHDARKAADAYRVTEQEAAAAFASIEALVEAWEEGRP